MPQPFYTIGHSTRPLDDFVGLLRDNHVAFVADVRTVPRSRTNPQYNADTLPKALAEYQIGYEHMAALGGLRGKNRALDPAVNGFWQNDSFHNYADYATTDDFGRGLAHLREIGTDKRCAIMCAEAVWWRCHRRIIADYLLAAGDAVLHILGAGHAEPAHMTDGVKVEGGIVTYPAK